MATGEEKEIVKIDTDLLNCSICYEPLWPPVSQCWNGHVACTTCWSKLQHNCHMCKVPVVSRNIALEKILESVHVTCTYAYLGCNKYVSYSQRQVHTDTCEFGPSLCPIPGCTHKASSGDWREHFMFDHRFHCNHYTYGQRCALLFDEVDPYYTLFGPGTCKDLFLLVKVSIPNVGNALSIYYIDLPDRGQKVYPYELEVHAYDYENEITSSIHSKSQAVSIKEWKRGEVRGRFCLGPSGFADSQMKVNVLINKKEGKKRDILLAD